MTHLLTHSPLANLIDATLACEYAYSKLVKVDSEAEGLVKILSLNLVGMLMFGSDFEV